MAGEPSGTSRKRLRTAPPPANDPMRDIADRYNLTFQNFRSLVHAVVSDRKTLDFAKSFDATAELPPFVQKRDIDTFEQISAHEQDHFGVPFLELNWTDDEDEDDGEYAPPRKLRARRGGPGRSRDNGHDDDDDDTLVAGRTRTRSSTADTLDPNDLANALYDDTYRAFLDSLKSDHAAVPFGYRDGDGDDDDDDDDDDEYRPEPVNINDILDDLPSSPPSLSAPATQSVEGARITRVDDVPFYSSPGTPSRFLLANTPAPETPLPIGASLTALTSTERRQLRSRRDVYEPTPTQCARLVGQLTRFVELLTVTFMLTREFSCFPLAMANEAAHMLSQLHTLAERKRKTLLHAVPNLNAACALRTLPVPSDRRVLMKEYEAMDATYKRMRSRHKGTLKPMLRLSSDSIQHLATAPHLFPTPHAILFEPDVVAKVRFVPGEERLVCAGIARFGTHNWERLSTFYLPIKTPQQLAIKFKNAMSTKARPNVIKSFMDAMKAPLTAAEISVLDENLPLYDNDVVRVWQAGATQRPPAFLKRLLDRSKQQQTQQTQQTPMSPRAQGSSPAAETMDTNGIPTGVATAANGHRCAAGAYVDEDGFEHHSLPSSEDERFDEVEMSDDDAPNGFAAQQQQQPDNTDENGDADYEEQEISRGRAGPARYPLRHRTQPTTPMDGADVIELATSGSEADFEEDELATSDDEE